MSLPIGMLTSLVSIKDSSKNESKSQQSSYSRGAALRWYQSKIVQRTKANHNLNQFFYFHSNVGINQRQFKERKQITTVSVSLFQHCRLVSIKDSSKNESKSQQQKIYRYRKRVGINQRQFKERKQITTDVLCIRQMARLVSIKDSSKNESKSQPVDNICRNLRSWYQSKIVQRTKANHNKLDYSMLCRSVGINQRQFKERKQITTMCRVP